MLTSVCMGSDCGYLINESSMVENVIDIRGKWGTDQVVSLKTCWYLWDPNISSRAIAIYRLDKFFFSTFAFVMCLSMKEVFFLFERLGIFSFKIFPDLFSSWLDYWIRIFHKDRESAMTNYCDMNNTGETISVLHFLHRPYILLLW